MESARDIGRDLLSMQKDKIISLGNVFDFPYRELQPTLVELVEKLGANWLMWGTDMPNVERYCTYRQTLDTFRVHCQGLLSEEDLANILGGTTERLFSA